MTGTFELSKNIDKYMKYMDFIKSSSPLTLKHYRIDLTQAFFYEDNSQLNRKKYTEAEILQEVRKAFQRWASLSLASRNRKAGTLKSFFGWAFSEGLTQKDLSMQVICPKVPKRIPHFLSVDEVLSVLKSFSATEHQKDKILFVLLYGGGLRVSEACNLKWSSVQIERRVLNIHGKGNKERTLVVPKLVAAYLKSWKKISSGDYVFGETPLDPRTAYEMVRRSGSRAGLLKPLHPHALRHSFATHLLSSGANLRTLQELLGHDSLQATEKYTHLGVDQLARTLEKIHPLGKGK